MPATSRAGAGHAIPSSGTFLAPVSGHATRLGRLIMAGEVVDAVPLVPRPMRVMDGWVLSFVHRGAGTYRHRDGRTDPIGPGCLTVVPPRVPHWYGTDQNRRWSEVFAVVDGPLFDLLGHTGVLPPAGPRRVVAIDTGSAAKTAPGRSAQALRAIVHRVPHGREQAEHQLTALTDWLIQHSGSAAADQDNPSAPIARAAAALAADSTGELSMHEVAELTGLPYDVFRRRFRAETGLPPAQFRNARRLQAAADLLRLTTMSVREIAARLGYTDEFHLSRRFKQRFGVAPSDYRRGT